MKNKIQVSRLERPEHSGDWHDKPLKWQAVGPASEIQKFSTRAHAEQYATFRRHTNQQDAIRAFVLA